LTLTHRALSICSSEKLQDELDTITSILLNHGYPEHIIKASISKKIRQFNAPLKFGPKICPVYLHLPYIGPTSTKFDKQIKPCAVKTCFATLKPCVVYTTKDLCLANKKNILFAFQLSNVIYQFSCHCDSLYVGHTSQRLQDRIKQHILKSIRNTACSQARIQPKRDCNFSTQLPITQLSAILPSDFTSFVPQKRIKITLHSLGLESSNCLQSVCITEIYHHIKYKENLEALDFRV